MGLNRLFNAYLDDFNQITILLPKDYFNGISHSFVLIHDYEEIDLYIEHVIDLGEYQKYICLLPTFIELGILYFVRDDYGNKTELQSGAIVRSERFDTLYYYEKKDLGVTYHKEQSTFKLWAPTATKVSLVLVRNDNKEILPLKRKQKGIYELTILGDLEGCLYRYLVENNNRQMEIIDVYGKSSSANHEYSGIINPENLYQVKPLKNNRKGLTDIIIYEISIRDFSMDKNSGVKQRGKYLGLTEVHTKTEKGYKTGIDYLVDLGITHVQILPFFDFGGVDEHNVDKFYNWGYNPEQYNTPEGSFSLYPDDLYARLNELRQMINCFHEHNIGVIMDVVFNHVHDISKFPFEYMVPGYFYRYDEYGMPSNGSGCGNDIATEREMVRKFIIDSIKYWAKEYKMDGFRFDLMGMIDVDTMNRIRKELTDINPHIIIYGEGWNLDTPISNSIKSSINNAYKLPGVGFFNDRYRDLIKGYTFDVYDLGFAFGNLSMVEEVKQLIAGSVGYKKNSRYIFFEPYQTINFIECHDNLTMYDKIKQAYDGENKEQRLKRQRLATSILLLSQGIPFIHSGQEFYRTKYGIENSYNSPDKINKIDWKRRDQYIEDVEYIKELIKVRRSHGAIHLISTSKIKKHLSFIESEKGILIYLLDHVGQYGHYEQLRIIINTTDEDYAYKLNTEFKLIFDGRAYVKGKNLTNYIIVDAISVLIIGK